MTAVNGINALKKRPSVGLLSYSTQLPASIDWRNGISYTPEGCIAPDATPVCGEVSKPDAEPIELVTFEPFGIVSVDGCDDKWMLREELHDRAVRVLDMGQGSLLARELLYSTNSNNPSLSNTAIDVSASDDEPVGWLEAATTLLFNMQNAGYVGDVTLHAPNWLLPSFVASGVGDVDTVTGRASIGNHSVVFDAGYSGLISPNGDAGGAVPNVAGWVYASGPVEYAFSDLLSDTDSAGFDQGINQRYALAERAAIVRFDPCQVFAVLVDLCKS